MKACYANQVRNIDKSAEHDGAMPSIILMENAGLACVEELGKRFNLYNKRAAVFCGKGNNGGDGFAIARMLHNRGAQVSVFLVCGDEFRGDAGINYDIIEKMPINIETIYDTEMLECIIPSFDIVIDAIFGTGVRGKIEGIPAYVIEKINKYAKFIMSVDIPSGLNSDTGEICGVCIKADVTVTFAAYKVGMFFYPGADYTGEIVLDKISIPDYIIDNAEFAAKVMDDDEFARIFPMRKNNSQKGDYGKLIAIGGSKGMSGAIYMAGEAALNAGAGLVTLAVPKCINDILEIKTTEAMTLPISDMDGCFGLSAADEVVGYINRADAVLVGPGMGRNENNHNVIQKILQSSGVPVIVDADALNVIAQDMDMLKNCTSDLIFTPHEMEMSRLTGMDLEYIQKNRLTVAKDFAEKYGVTLILKGHHTIVTAPDGLQYINNTGNSGLAKGGSGDVLAGIVSAFAARGISASQAAVMAVYVHGRAADYVMNENGIESVTAKSLIKAIGKTIDSICTKNYR